MPEEGDPGYQEAMAQLETIRGQAAVTTPALVELLDSTGGGGIVQYLRNRAVGF